MSVDYPHISRTDTTKILALVQEYADKLRALCVAYADAKAKRQQMALISVTLLTMMTAIFLSVGKLYIPNADFSSRIFQGIMAVFGACIAMVPLYWIGPLARSKNLYDVHQVALTVERLLRTASQYSEHATQALGDKFEFDIRLAEAEAALHVYYNVFGHSAKQANGGFWDR